MLMGNDTLTREPVRPSPISNTELNEARLPRPAALAGMELRFRGAMFESFIERAPLRALALFVVFGVTYAIIWLMAPDVLAALAEKARAIEGMTVVGGMLAVMLLVIVLLSLVFIPRSMVLAIIAFSVPVVVAVSFFQKGQHFAGVLSTVVFSVAVGTFWRANLIRFHSAWLSADPRMSADQAKAWMAARSSGWVVPKISEAARIIGCYLRYEHSSSPGVWLPPSPVADRVFSFALFNGSIFTSAVLLAHRVAGGWWQFAVSVAVSAIFLVGVLMRAVGEATALSRKCEALFLDDGRSGFQQCSDRLRNSRHVSLDVITGAPIREAEHLFLGFEPWKRFPVMLHQALLEEHAYISGRTGAGKTSMGLMQIVIQLLRGYRKSESEWSEKTPMIIVDLKGDETLFQTAKAEAEARGQKFRFFTLEPGRASYRFNPFREFAAGTMSVPQLVRLNLDALDLYHGTGYGKGYFSQRSRFMLSKALRNPAGIESFKDLYARLETLYKEHPQDFQDAFELLSVIESLTHFTALATSTTDEAGDETIRLSRAIEESEVIYFWLPSALESATVAQVGKMLLFSLRAAVYNRQREGKDKRQVFLVIDEFQKLAGENFQNILQQARSAGVGAILANQSLADLKTPDWDLTPAIRTNTRVKMSFSVTELEEIKAFRELSGEEIQTYGASEVDEIRLRLSTIDLALLSDHPKRLLLHVSSGSGYTQFGGLPIPVETDWPISKALADERAAMPWPDQPKMVEPVPEPPKPKKKPVVKPAASTSVDQHYQDEAKRLFSE